MGDFGFAIPWITLIVPHFWLVGDTGLIFGDFSLQTFLQLLVKPFLSFVAKKIEKLAVEDTWSASFLRQKWEKWTFFQFFTIKSYCFVMNLNSTQLQLSFEVYYIFVAKNKNFWIFCLKILTRLTFATSSSSHMMNERKSLVK